MGLKLPARQAARPGCPASGDLRATLVSAQRPAAALVSDQGEPWPFRPSWTMAGPVDGGISSPRLIFVDREGGTRRPKMIDYWFPVAPDLDVARRLELVERAHRRPCTACSGAAPK